MKVGSLSSHDDYASENVTKKMNLRFFKLDRVSDALGSLNMPNEREFSWSWILKHCIKGTFCRRAFTSFRTRLIKKCYLLIVQFTLMKCIQKCVMHLQCCCFWSFFFHSFKPTNWDYYFNHVFRPVRMRLDLNTNMELVGLREPYKATYKVTKTPRKTQDRQTSLKFDQTAVAFKLPFLFSSIL